MGSSKPATQTTTQTVKSSPWGPQQPYLKEVFGEAQNNYNNPMQYFPGSTVSSFSPESSIAMNLASNRALTGSPLVQGAQNYNQDVVGGNYLQSNPAFGYLQNTASGGMLNNNPYVDAMFDQASSRALGAVSSQFGAAGRYGSGNHMAALGDQMNNLATNIYGQNYANERTNQLNAANSLGSMYGQERGLQQQAMGAAPGLADQDYKDIGALASVGQAREGQQQKLINDQIMRQEFGQMEPWQRLALYNSFIQGNYGGTSTGTATGTQQSASNPLLSGLGGAASGASMGMSFGPIGAGIGGLAGGLLGAFS